MKTNDLRYFLDELLKRSKLAMIFHHGTWSDLWECGDRSPHSQIRLGAPAHTVREGGMRKEPEKPHYGGGGNTAFTKPS